jgi:hypothetical protein
MAKRVPGGDPKDFTSVSAYSTAEALVEILKRCGNDLTPENILKQATSGEPILLSLALPGIDYRPTPENHGGILKLQPSRVSGEHYSAVGPLVE